MGHSDDGKKKEERRFSTSYGARPGRSRYAMHGRQRSKSNVSMQSQTISHALSTVIHNDDDDSLSSSEDDEEEEDFAIDPHLSNMASSPKSIGRSTSAIVSSTSKDKSSGHSPGGNGGRASIFNGRDSISVKGGIPGFSPSNSSPNPDGPQYLQFLASRAITNKMFNERDADRLCKSAVSSKEEFVTVHSMWVSTVDELLLKHTRNEFKEDKRKSNKAGRRGSKSSFQIRAAFQDIEDEKEITVSETKICCIVGYPFGQTATRAKVAEAKYAVNDGAERVRLMVNGAKVVGEDWDYILDEVKKVMDAVPTADVRVVLPETSQISDELKATFNKKMTEVMEEREALAQSATTTETTTETVTPKVETPKTTM